MAIRTITSANLVFMLSIDSIVTTPTRLQGFAVDDAFTQGEVTNAELQLGVDAQVGAGWVPVLIPQKFMFLASSPSVDLFEQWAATNAQQKSSFVAQGTALLTSVGKSYDLRDGYLTGYSPMPDAKKVLEPRGFTITWSLIQPSPTA